MMYSEKGYDFREKVLRKAIVFLIAAAFLIPLITPEVFAATGVSVSTSPEGNIKGGDTFTINVTYSGTGRVEGQLTYNTDYLTYLSGGSSSGNTGYVQLKDASSNGTISFKVKFQAIKSGSTKVELSTIEMYDTDDVFMEDNPSASIPVSITGDAASDQLITETQDADDEDVTETTMEEGIDERGDEGEMTNTTLILIISAAVLAAAIGVIVAVLLKKKKKRVK